MGKGHKKNKSSTSSSTGRSPPAPEAPAQSTGPTSDPTSEPINLSNTKTTTTTITTDLPDPQAPTDSTDRASPTPHSPTRVRYIGGRPHLPVPPPALSPVAPAAHTTTHPPASPKRARYVHGSRADLPLLDVSASPHKHTLDEVGTPNADYQREAKRHREREGMRFEFPGPVAEKFESGKSQWELEDQVRVLRGRVERLEMERWGRVGEGAEEGAARKMVGIEGGKAADVGEKVKRVLVREEEVVDPWRVLVAGAVCLGCAVVGGMVGAAVERGLFRGRVAEMLWGSVKGSPV